MTPAEHITEAESLLSQADSYPAGMTGEYARELVGKATTHALIAIAVELGAPHPPGPGGGEGSGTQAPPG